MFEPLHTLQCSARAPRAACARRGEALIDFAAFKLRAAQWQAAAEANPGARFGLFIEDGVEFAAALFGLWHAGKTVWLPGDALPATLAALAREVDGLLGDVPRPAFAPADIRKDSLSAAWQAVQRAWAHPDVAAFCRKAVTDASFLRHANECWDVN